MKRILTVLWAAVFTTALLPGCKEDYTTYSDREYVMFADSAAIYMVLEDQDHFSVPVSSTVTRSYDRTFGVEVIDKGSNAIEGWHYRILSNTVTIKAGERTASIPVRGRYENISETDSLGFTLKLVIPEAYSWELYPDQTDVTMYKSCPYDINEFTGWCVVTSAFLSSYPGLNARNQRLVWSEKVPGEENTIVFRDWLFDGYDITVSFDPDDPAQPGVTMEDDQILSDEMLLFGQILGDNKVRASLSPLRESYFNSCQQFAVVWIKVDVWDLNNYVGLVGHFMNLVEWISDEEAERLQREEGY